MAFSQVDDLSYHQTGAMFGSRLVMEAQQQRIVDANTSENMKGFVNQCVVTEFKKGIKYTNQDLRTSPDIWDLVKTNASKAMMVSYKEKGLRAEIISCKEAADKLETTLKTESEGALGRLQSKFFGSSQRSSSLFAREIKTRLRTAFKAITNAAEKAAEEQMRQILMVHAAVDGIEKHSIALGNAPKYAAKRAFLSQKTTFETMGELAALTLPLMKGIFEALIYSLFIFLIPITLMQGGFQLLKTWTQWLITVNLWPPLYAIVNGLATSYAAKSSIAAGGALGVTIVTSSGVMEANGNAAAIAGYMAMLIPVISGAIVFGGSAVFVGLASSLTGVSQSIGGAMAQEAVSGNYSMGNVQAMNTNAFNTTSSQYTDSPSFNSGSFRSSDGHVDQVTGSDGSQIYNVAASHLPSSIGSNESYNQQAMDQYNDTLNVAENQSAAIQQSEAAARRSVLEKAFHEGSSQSYNDASSQSQSAQVSTSANTLKSLTERFAKTNQLGVGDAATLLAGVSGGLSMSGVMGGPGGLGANLGLNGNAQVSADAQKRDLYDKAKDVTSSEQWQKAESALIQDARDSRFTESQDQGNKFNDSINASFDKSSQLRSDLSLTQNRAKALSHTIQNSHQRSAHMNNNDNDTALASIAAAQGISKGQAARMAAENPESFKSLAGNYTASQSPSANLPQQQTLSSDYEARAESLLKRGRQKVEQANGDYSQTIHNRVAQTLNVDDHNIRENVSNKLEITPASIQNSKNINTARSEPLIESTQHSLDQSVRSVAGARARHNIRNNFSNSSEETAKAPSKEHENILKNSGSQIDN